MTLDRLRAHPVVLGIVIWLLLGGVVGTAIWARDRSLGSKLRAHGVTTLATVTGIEPVNSNTVFYRYVVNGRIYDSGYFGDGPEGDARHLKVGQRIHVVYDTHDPSASCYCDVAILAKSADWWRSLLPGLFIASVVAVLIPIGIHWWNKRAP